MERVRAAFPFPGYMNYPTGYVTLANAVQRHLPTGSSILDFGCGPCDKTAILSAMGYSCAGFDDLQDFWHLISDNRQKIVRFATDMGIDLTVGDGRCALPYPCESFDMVILSDVIEHFHVSPRDQLNDLLALVKSGGLLFITVPNAVNIRKRMAVLRGKTNMPDYAYFYWHPGEWRSHVREYVRDDLTQLMSYLDLHILELSTFSQFLFRVPSVLRLAYHVATTIFPAWRDTWLVIARKPAGWQARRSIPEDELTRLLGRYNYYAF